MALNLLYFNLGKCINKTEKKTIIKIDSLVISQWYGSVNKFEN